MKTTIDPNDPKRINVTIDLYPKAKRILIATLSFLVLLVWLTAAYSLFHAPSLIIQAVFLFTAISLASQLWKTHRMKTYRITKNIA